MYVKVQLLRGLKQPLLYALPPTLNHVDLIGTLVRVPLRNRTEVGVIVAYAPAHLRPPFAVRTIDALGILPIDAHFNAFLHSVAEYYAIETSALLGKIATTATATKRARKLPAQRNNVGSREHVSSTLTDNQRVVVETLSTALLSSRYFPALLHGVTGSGKTEIYKALIQDAHQQGKISMVLAPEVSLARQLQHNLLVGLPPEIPIYGFHSASSATERLLVWQYLTERKPMVIVGVHLPIFLPTDLLGLIIVDEEHEIGYQEKNHPKINSKEVALMRAHAYNIPIVLGSATPSLTSLHNVDTRGWAHFSLKERFDGAFPKIKYALLTHPQKRYSFWITRELEQALRTQLDAKKQSLLFLNRRGFSFFVQCKKCSFVPTCTNCAVSLTLHEKEVLRCHYCTFHQPLSATCPGCGGGKDHLIKKGVGTQQIVTTLQALFPRATIARADTDISCKKKAWTQIIADFSSGKIDILVGTQIIAKGFHFPRLTLIGIIWADLTIHFPLYNAAETTLQQLIQVAGRAGRCNPESTVIVQTMARHEIFSFVDELRYPDFCQGELKVRKEAGYPPFVRFAEIELRHDDETVVQNEANTAAHLLRTITTENAQNMCVLGPVRPMVAKIQRIHLRKIYLKAARSDHIATLFAQLMRMKYKCSIYLTQNPLW